MEYHIQKECETSENRTDWITSTVYFKNNCLADNIINICNKHNGDLLRALHKK